MEKLSLLLFSNSEFLTLLCFTFVILIIGYFLYKLDYFKAENHHSILSLILMMIIYSVISFWKLGSTTFPITTWQPTAEKQQITFDFGKSEKFDAIYTIYGEGDTNSNPSAYQIGTNNIHLYASNDLQEWTRIASLKQGNIYTYAIEQGNWQYRYIKLVDLSENSSLSEIGFRFYCTALSD